MRATGAIAGLTLAGTATATTPSATSTTLAEADTTFDPTFLPLGYRLPGALYTPSADAPRSRSRVGFVVIHPNFSVLTASKTAFTNVNIGAEFASRGYHALIADTEEQPGSYHIHELLPDVGAAVAHFRDHTDVETVVLVGYSHGAHLMAFYQNVAENGLQVAQRDELLYPAPDDLSEQPPADGVLVLDGVLGTGPGGGGPPEGLLEIDPRIANNDPGTVVATADIYDEANGYNPNGEATYSDEFLATVFEAQADRMQELIAVAQNDYQEVQNGTADFPDQTPFIAVGLNTPVADLDNDLLAHTRYEWPLITADGSVVTKQVPYIGPPADSDPEITYSDETLTTTAGRFLSTNAIRTTGEYTITEDTIEGLDYASTNAEAPGNLETVSSPLLILGFTGTRNYNVHCEIMMLHAGSAKKSLIYIEGAGHSLEPIAEKYGDTVEKIFTAIDNWTEDTFL